MEAESGTPPGAAEKATGVPAGSGTDTAGGATADARDEDQPGDDNRARLQDEIRSSVADGRTAFGNRSSKVVILGDKITFEGPVTGGDAILAQDRKRPVLCTLSVRTVAETVRVHVEPGGFDDLARAVRQHQVLLLRARRRWGSTTTATRLMSMMKAVHELRFSEPLATLRVEEQLPTESGFILEGLNARQLADVSARDLLELEDRLAKHRGKLIVIIDADTRLPDHAVDRATRPMLAPPPAHDLVASHLAASLGSRTAADQLLVDYKLEKPLRAVEAESYDVRQLVELARDLADVQNGQGTVDEALARFEDRSQRDVEAWLDEITAFDQRATVISLAVLNGMSYDAVSRAATLLEQAWRVDEAGNGRRPPRTRQPRKARLQASRARISTEVRRTRYGPAEMEVVSFVDDSYPARILYHLWHEHDYDRDVVLQWLNTVAEDVEGRVRIRAAMAMGYLGRFAFDTIRRDVVAPWARSGNGNERELAVAALALPVQHPETAARVVRMVLEWSNQSSRALRLSAARALGASVGHAVPGGPDERLAALAKNSDASLATAIGDSIAELLVDADVDRQLGLLRLLDAWSAEGRAGRQRAGVLGFLVVAANIWTTQSVAVGETTWPTLLWLASAAGPATDVGRVDIDADPAYLTAVREVVARLWGRVLLAPGADHAVRGVLRSWASAAERAPELRPALISLLIEAATTRRQADLLASHARGWRDRRPLAPHLAERLLDVLDRRGSTS